jgi:hypothetical protein
MEDPAEVQNPENRESVSDAGFGPLLGGTCLLVGAAEGARGGVGQLLGRFPSRGACQHLFSVRSPR